MDLCEKDCGHSSTVYTNIDSEIIEKTVSILSAMSDTARLNILLLLDENQELCVSEIASILDDKVNTISMRLRKLYDAGLVKKRRDAKHIFYALKDQHIVTIIHNAIAHAEH